MKKSYRRPIVPHPSDPTAALVELTRGYWAIIDAADAIEVGRFNWRADDTGKAAVYAARTAYSRGGGKNKVYLHRFIGDRMGLATGLHVDHRSGNSLDDRRSNLRSATSTQNNQNARRRKDNTSGIKGVHFSRQMKRWQSYVGVGGRQKFLGQFSTKEEAVEAVTVARAKLHGDFARTN